MNQYESPDESLSDLEPDDAATAEAFRSLVADITFDRPIETIIGARPSRSPQRRWKLLAAAAVTCGLIGGAVLAGTGGNERNVAFAEWTATPQPLTTDERAAIESSCEEQLASPRDDGFPDSPQFDGAVIDRRGSIAAAAAFDGELQLTCATQLLDGRWSAFASSMGMGPLSAAPGLGRAFNSDAEINFAHGLAPDAASVEVVIPGLAPATATVDDGRYVVWLPFTFDWTDRPADVEVRFLDAAGNVITTTHP